MWSPILMYKKTVIFRKFAICSSLNDAQIANFLKITVFLYADDTIVLADSVKGLQKALNPIHQYFKGWKIHLAFEKIAPHYVWSMASLADSQLKVE